jgi:hypothetical protein
MFSGTAWMLLCRLPGFWILEEAGGVVREESDARVVLAGSEFRGEFSSGVSIGRQTQPVPDNKIS